MGRHLASLLKASGHEVHGIARDAAPRGVATHTACDVRNKEAIDKVLATINPELIFHLAGFASARQAMESPLECWDVNVRGTVNLLEAATHHCPRASIVLVGSGMQYGIVRNSEQPIRESEPMQPREPYGASKAAAELAGMQWAFSHDFRVVLLRAFNATGPGQSPDFFCSDFAQQVARIERGLQGPVIATGDLTVARDLLDVRDVAVALSVAAERCHPGHPYNVCTGTAISVGDVLEALRSMARTQFEVRTDSGKIRKIDIPVLRGDSTEFRTATGWQPRIPLRETLQDLLNFWRQSIGASDVRRS